ncbi:hypothetical protein [Streptomyces griseoaurantiacus]|uniref:hypothetical protein n=1 Tax=Streptomyces griseoaurantiacus TaxID=68213 RepID=UPI0036873096
MNGKIVEFSGTLKVAGTLDVPHVIGVGMSRTKKMLVSGFVVYLSPMGGQWRTRTVQITGHVLKENGEPGRSRGQKTFYVDDPETPGWVMEVLAGCVPLQEAPSPAREFAVSVGSDAT